MQNSVLLVVDEAEVGDLLQHALRRRQLDVVLAGTMQAVHSQREQHIFDLIVINTFSPKLDPVQMIRNLRKESVVPILLLTSRRDDEYLLEAYRAGADECILRPIDTRLLLAKVTAW
ncbi:MAG: response regulator, partial [Chloroflexi bacterium]|nr:response regulator [Chloroflexota bacterium]